MSTFLYHSPCGSHLAVSDDGASLALESGSCEEGAKYGGGNCSVSQECLRA